MANILRILLVSSSNLGQLVFQLWEERLLYPYSVNFWGKTFLLLAFIWNILSPSISVSYIFFVSWEFENLRHADLWELMEMCSLIGYQPSVVDNYCKFEFIIVATCILPHLSWLVSHSNVDVFVLMTVQHEGCMLWKEHETLFYHGTLIIDF